MASPEVSHRSLLNLASVPFVQYTIWLVILNVFALVWTFITL